MTNKNKPKVIKIEVKYIDTSIKCQSNKPQEDCKAADCSWFNHSQVGLW